MSEAIYQRLAPIFHEVFDDDDIVLSPTTTAADVVGWDSLGHIRLVVAVEQAFEVRFSAEEISTLENLGQFVGLLEQRVGS